MKRPSLSGLATVLALHGLLLYGLWHIRFLPSAFEARPVFVHLIDTQATPEMASADPPKPQQEELRKPVERPVPPSQLLARPPVETPHEATIPAPQPAPPRIEIAAVAPVAPAEPPAPPKPVGPILMGGELSLACPERTSPAYPAASRRLGEEGKVVLRVELDESGRIDRAAIQSSSGFARLDAAAMHAVSHWRCRPAERDGQPVRAVALQPFNFVLEGP